jgi:hypothetical protein
MQNFQLPPKMAYSLEYIIADKVSGGFPAQQPL